MTTDQIDQVVHNEIIKLNAYPSPLRYMGFPKSICTSVNNIACHGIPDDRPLMDGDIINIDITLFYNGFHGDCSKTFLVGDVDERGKYLVAATEEALYKVRLVRDLVLNEAFSYLFPFRLLKAVDPACLIKQ